MAAKGVPATARAHTSSILAMGEETEKDHTREELLKTMVGSIASLTRHVDFDVLLSRF